MRFQGDIAIVTGSGSGIGQATAVRLATEGAKVSVWDIDQDSAERTAAGISARGGIAVAVEVDVSDESSIVGAFDGVLSTWGAPSVLVNNAGILRVAPALDTTAAVFDEVISTNLRSVFLTSVRAARLMVEHAVHGRIVNVSSIHAVISEPNASAYTAAKGGIEAMSRTFASEWAPHRIRVNCVRPGATITALTKELYTDDVRRSLSVRVPLGYIAEAEEIAAGICFLASEESSYCTGTTLNIDGGYIMDGSLPDAAYT